MDKSEERGKPWLDWQPMETAPKKGMILIANTKKSQPIYAVVFFDDSESIHHPWQIIDSADAYHRDYPDMWTRIPAPTTPQDAKTPELPQDNTQGRG